MSAVPITLWSFYRGLIRRLIASGFKVILVSSDLPDLYKLEEELHCEVFPANITREISPLSDALSICRLWRFFRRHRCQIVHAHTPKGGLVGVISSWLACVPNRIYTIHGLVSETSNGLKKKLLWFCEWLCCKLATQVLAVSPSLRQLVVNEGICPAWKIQVLGHGSACGIDIEKYTRNESFLSLRTSFRTKYNIKDGAVVIGYVGRIVPDKGINTLIDAFEKVQKKKKDSYLLLVGNLDSVRDKLDDRILGRIKNNKNIIFNNEFVQDVIPYYAAMDIVTLPSRREGFGLTIIEASALELPVVATRVTGCIDAAVDGETGLLIEMDNIQHLADAILKLVGDPNLRKKLGQNGCARVRELFDSQALIVEYIDFYGRLISS